MSEYKICLLVPHFNHVESFNSFLPKLLSTMLTFIVVDDGSDSDVKDKLKSILSNIDHCHLLEHSHNQGKGAAIMTGVKFAQELAFTHVLQIDADGQHDVNDINSFITYSKEHRKQIVSGAPRFDQNAPKARVYGRKVTDFWVAIETLSFGIKDSLCGFRIYPIKEFNQVKSSYHLGSRMTIDTEILVKSVWQGIKLHFITTKVIYPKNSVSHFHYIRDNIRLILLHIQLMIGMLIRFPKLLLWRLSGKMASAS